MEINLSKVNNASLSKNAIIALETTEKLRNRSGSTIHKRTVEEIDKICFSKWWTNHVSELPICYDYIEFSTIADGLNFNGLYYYSLDRNIENNFYNNNNEEWQAAGTEDYVLFGNNEFFYYTQSKITGKFVMFDNSYNSIEAEYDTFSELLVRSLEEASLNEFAEELLNSNIQ